MDPAALYEEISQISFSEIAGKNEDPDRVTLDLNLYDGRNTCAGYADVEWKSSHPHIVSPSGFVNGGEKPEAVTLTGIFTYQDYPTLRAECTLTVTVLPTTEKKASQLPADKIRVFIAGDSTACNYPHTGEANRYPQPGWGQTLLERFNDSVFVVNCARSGRSSKSFLREDNYRFICDHIQAGDYLIIQFAHNDSKKEDPDRYTDPADGSYQQCLYTYIRTAQNAGAHPLLCTSISRNMTDDHSLEPYVNAVKELGARENIPVLDLYAMTREYILREGTEKAALLFKHINARDPRFSDNPEFLRSQYYDCDSRDNTHLNIYGARFICGLAAQALQKLNHPLAAYLVQEQ